MHCLNRHKFFSTILMLHVVMTDAFLFMGRQTRAIDIIKEHGYPAQLHTNIHTEDGYLVDMQRIPHGLNNANQTDKPAVLLMHGFMGSAENWLVTGPDKGLAFILADAGYDVWLGNARGTIHSRKHTHLNPNFDPRYWDFSWHEIGQFDLPANIDRIIEETGQSKIFYIGHSQGTTSFFVMASTRPQFNDKIRLMIALAPVAYMSNLDNPIFQLMAGVSMKFNWLLSNLLVGIGEFFPNNQLLSLAGETICHEYSPMQEICANLLFLLSGYNSGQMDRAELRHILRASPGGASTKQFLHYSQGVTSGQFRYYDYGMLLNYIKYGSWTPPIYKINQISAPIALIYSRNDWLVSLQDVTRLQRQLPNVVYSHLVPYERFNHLDFLWATNVKDLVYNDLVDLLREY